MLKIGENAVREGGRYSGPGSRFVFYGENFVFNPVTGMFYRLNATAAFALRAIEDGTRPVDLPDLIRRHYGLDHGSAVRDAELFLNELTQLGLIEEGIG